MIYSEKRHEQALEVHGRRWEEMHRAAREFGYDSLEYQQSRQDMLDAYRWMRHMARLPRKRAA